jgi:hypothetical protein
VPAATPFESFDGGKHSGVARWYSFAALAVAAFLLIGLAWVSIQWFVLGETECDRGKCGKMGEFAESAGVGLFVIWAVPALFAAWALARTGKRRT